MELEFLVVDLSFAATGPFALPVATVRVQPANRSHGQLSAAYIDVKIKLFDILPTGSDLPAIADAAMRTAKAMLQPAAVVSHLQATLDAEARQQREHDAALAASFQSPGA